MRQVSSYSVDKLWSAVISLMLSEFLPVFRFCSTEHFKSHRLPCWGSAIMTRSIQFVWPIHLWRKLFGWCFFTISVLEHLFYVVTILPFFLSSILHPFLIFKGAFLAVNLAVSSCNSDCARWKNNHSRISCFNSDCIYLFSITFIPGLIEPSVLLCSIHGSPPTFNVLNWDLTLKIHPPGSTCLISNVKKNKYPNFSVLCSANFIMSVISTDFITLYY